MTEFVEDWTILHTLGEGAFGEVKLLEHRGSGDTVALKIIDLHKHKEAAEHVKKEILIHKALAHPNIIRFYGTRQENLFQYIFLEYASGGELFNKIEPDVGMAVWEAQRYFQQLMEGVEYLHSRGIAHRDLKPENLLLDHNNTLKITDFGMATLFRLRGRVRKLEHRCGTLPYIPPEILKHPYDAEPADIWSCGIVLVAMLSGELPWDQPTEDKHEYKCWIEGKYMLLSPWRKLDNMALSLARCILTADPEQRFTIEKIKNHRWMKHAFHKTEDVVDSTDGIKSAKRLCSNNELCPTQKDTLDIEPLAYSQPVPYNEKQSTEHIIEMVKHGDYISFSQPVHFDNLIINSQFQFTQSPINKNNFHKLVARMTRFFVKTSCEKTLQILCKKLENNSYTWNTDTSGLITISTVDRRKMQLVFKAYIINMDGKFLVDFRLSKGCGLEFKKRFLKLKASLDDIIHHECEHT